MSHIDGRKGSWVRLDKLPADTMSLERPLLSEDSGLHVDVGSETAATQRTSSPERSLDVITVSPVPEVPCSTSPPSINGDLPRKKKLVWAADVEASQEVSDGASSPQSASSRDNLLSPEVDGRPRPQSYILYEDKQGEGEGYIHVRRERSRSSMFAGASIVSEGDITDDQFSYRTDFIKVEVPSSNPDGSSMSTAQELQICKRTVLKPYLIFLKMIGWRSFFGSRQDINPSRWIKVLNVTYPTVLFLLLVLSCCTQVVTCFYRDQPAQNRTATRENPLLIDCREDLFTRLIFPDMLLLLAYLWGLYIFRFGAPEHLITLVETVFLSTQHIRKGQVRMVTFMRLIMLCGFVWLVADFCISIARLFSLQLLSPHTYLFFLTGLDHGDNISGDHTTTEKALRFTFVIFDFFGFIVFDLLYIAVIITYTAQCQLVRLYMGTIIDKVLTRLQGYTLQQAMTDISQTYKFLQVVNGKLSALTSLCLLVFLEAAVSSLYGVFMLDRDAHTSGTLKVLGTVVGVCNVAIWSIITLVPVVQAARVTSRCQQLRRLGLSVGHRPFAYHNTPQLLLDSFVQYTNATRYRAKLAGIPIYPSFVIGGLFFLVLLGSFLVIFVPPLRIAPWF